MGSWLHAFSLPDQQLIEAAALDMGADPEDVAAQLIHNPELYS